MQIIDGVLARTEMTMNANGGSELLMTRLFNALGSERFEGFQIINSRIDQYCGLRDDLHRILWLHDLPDDPASKHLANGGWRKFHKLVFISNWQMQQYISAYNIPWSKCVVLQNSIIPIPKHVKPKGPIRLGYWSTPHRGLSLLVPVFDHLVNIGMDIELDVFSSFKLYGWEQNDAQFQELFEKCEQHPKINMHGTVSNDEIREHLKSIHILAYPNIWPETSCMVLMEAMSAGIAAVHPNYGALSETAANWTFMYQMQEDPHRHVNEFANILKGVIDNYDKDVVSTRVASAKQYADIFYDQNARVPEWEAVLKDVEGMPRAFDDTIIIKTS